MVYLLFIIGLVLLIVGADLLVRGASSMAKSFGISPLIIGLTVVAFGTSAPELAVSIGASSSGQAGVAIGNVIGSNIFNVLFILGLSALITPLMVSRQLIRQDVPLMIALSFVVFLFALDGFQRWEGILLFSGLLAYIGFLIRQNGKEKAVSGPLEKGEEGQKGSLSWAKNTLWIVVGLGMLVLGSRWLVAGAVTFATHLGVSELVIGLTIVAAGTSLPEVVTSIVAAIRGERDIAVGNVVGSNIFNIMGVLGMAVILSPSPMPTSASLIHFDIPVMIGVAFACLPIFFTGSSINRWEGLLLLGFYVAYVVFLILNATSHAALDTFGFVMYAFALPLTAAGLLFAAAGEWRKRTAK